MLKVWGRGSVANVQKVLWCLGELELDYALDEACPDTGNARDDSYLTSKVRHAVPVIDDDGFVLWEGNAIVRYLCFKHSLGALCPVDPAVRADAERWMDYQLSTVREHIHPLMRVELDPDRVAFHSKGFARAMSVLEATLADRPYLTGESFTMGDIPLGIMAYRWSVLNIERSPMPNIEAWYARLRDRKAFQENVCVPEDPIIGLRSTATG